jgi:hypothetical protein
MKLTTIAIFVCALVHAARAQQCGTTSTTTFSAGNVGGWAWGGPNETTPATGGFPTHYRRTDGLDTFAPQLQTSGSSIFTGNYRAAHVSALGVDLQSFYMDFPTSCQRPLSLMLWNDNSTPGNPNDDTYVYFLAEDVPCIDGLWHGYSVAVPSQSTTLPSGWAVDPNSTAAPNAVWNQVLTNVTQVTWFFGDPTFFFIFQMWSVGADNCRIAFDGGATTYCLSQKNSGNCQPRIEASGTPSATQALPFPITCADVLNQKSGIFFYGHARQATPFMGGTLCVVQPFRRTPVQSSGGSATGVDCTGSFTFDMNAWIRGGNDATLVPGATFYGQFWSRDPSSFISNVNFSNAITASVCP